jgi:hypothetical protein
MRSMMNSKAYILIDVADGRASEVLAMLQRRPSMAAVDGVKGPPDMVMVVEADEAQKLAEVTVKALTPASHLTDSIKCLPVSHRGVENAKVQDEMEGRARL